MIFPSLNKLYHFNACEIYLCVQSMCCVINTGVLSVCYIAFAWMWFVLYVGVYNMCVSKAYTSFSCVCDESITVYVLSWGNFVSIDGGDMLRSTQIGWCDQSWLELYKICSIFLALGSCSAITVFLPSSSLTWYFNFAKINMTNAYQSSLFLAFVKNVSKDTCTPRFITPQFIIARTWKQPRCPSADEWVRKLWYIYTMEYYSAIKKNTFESVLIGGWNWSLLYRVK